MKLMNYVKAGTRGTIAHVAVSNGDLVEFDQPLVYIDPLSS
ncbi:MAG: biotin/lipoyl-containing protein [Panacagrimonas sp.]